MAINQLKGHDVYSGGVMGHDHLMAGPASGGDFNIAWEPIPASKRR